MAVLLPLRALPRLDAILNAASAVLLCTGYCFIRRGKVLEHKTCMLSAFVCSACFLASYLYFHAHAGMVRFSGHGPIRPAYFALLISHTVLAAAIVPLVLIALYFALRGRFHRHKAVARWALPLWLYVSITGVIVYYLLFVLYRPLASVPGL